MATADVRIIGSWDDSDEGPAQGTVYFQRHDTIQSYATGMTGNQVERTTLDSSGSIDTTVVGADPDDPNPLAKAYRVIERIVGTRAAVVYDIEVTADSGTIDLSTVARLEAPPTAIPLYASLAALAAETADRIAADADLQEQIAAEGETVTATAPIVKTGTVLSLGIGDGLDVDEDGKLTATDGGGALGGGAAPVDLTGETPGALALDLSSGPHAVPPSQQSVTVLMPPSGPCDLTVTPPDGRERGDLDVVLLGDDGQDLTVTVPFVGSVSAVKSLTVSLTPTPDSFDGMMVFVVPQGAGGAVDSVNGKTGVVALDQDDVGDGATYKQFSATEKAKLSGVASGATANQSDATTNAAIALKADLASPALTGAPTAPTQSAGDSSTKLATTAFVRAALPPLSAKITSQYYAPIGIASGSQASPFTASGVMAAAPVFLWAGTYTEVGNAYYYGTGTSTIRLGLYDSAGTAGLPGSLVSGGDFGTFSCVAASPGAKAVSISFTLATSGWYWIAGLCDAYTSTTDFVGYSNTTGLGPTRLPGFPGGDTTNNPSCVIRTGVSTGSMPSTFGTPTNYSGNRFPAFRMYLSS